MNNQKVFLSFITYILLFNASAFPQYNSVRIAFSPNSSIPDNFLERAINAGYNYIEQGFNVSDASEWEDGSYLYFTNHNAPHNLLNNIRDAFIRVHNFGVQKKVSLKLIPRIAFGGRFSEHLRLTGDDIDWAPVYKVNLENRIKHNAYQNDESFGLVLANWLGLFTLGPEETKIQSNCPSYCVERGGKTCFSELMKILATAFDLAKSDPATNEPHTFPDYLEFIDIDHGEPYAVDENPVDRKYHVFPGLSLSDQWWMWDNLGSGCGLNWDDGRFLVPVPQPGDCWHCEIAY